MKKVAFKVLGCKVNSYEIEGIKHDFREAGYEIASSVEEIADVYVINTCSVTNTADKKSRQAIRKCINKNPEAIIIVVGCYSQLQTKEAQSIEGVDIILGTQNRNNLLKYVKKYEEDNTPIVNVDNIMKQKNFETLNVVSYENKTRGFLKIQEGCNNFCTFCIIPWARGLIRSQSPDIIIKQAEDMVANGIKEIVLTGIHTGGYGEDFEDYTFVDLLYALEEVEGLERIRISSIEITQLDDAFLEFMKNSKKLTDHLHIPIQSGDDDILKLMKRNYSLDEFYKKVLEIRNINPNIALSTDVIVGFPNEGDNEFENTCKTIKELKINNLHVFPYSKRNGTPAAKMDGQVPEDIKKDRVRKLIQIGEELNYEYNRKFLNKNVNVLLEKETDEYFEGYTSNYIKVILKKDDNPKVSLRNIENVLITDVDSDIVMGKK